MQREYQYFFKVNFKRQKEKNIEEKNRTEVRRY